MYEVTFFPILAASIVAVLIGFVWYHPKVFGTIWMRHTNLTPEAVEKGKKRLPVIVGVAFLVNMLAAYVMNYFGIAWGVYDIVGALELGFWCWLGFVAPTMLGIVLWEQKPIVLYVINALYWLVSFAAIAIVLVL